MSTSRVYTVGQVLTAAQVNDLPQGIMPTARTTSNVGPTSGTTELDIITQSVTIAGTTRRLRIRFHARNISGTVANDGFLVRIKEGATILQEYQVNVTALGFGCSFEAIVDNPTAGSHTYKATIQQFSGTGTATVSASATGAITLTIEDVGQV